MIYVATPYSHPELYTRVERYRSALAVVAELAKHRLNCYSPIVHWHHVNLEHKLDFGHHELWKWSDIPMMDLSVCGLFVKIQGWQTSKGMKHEETYMREKRKPVFWVYPDELESQFIKNFLHGG